MKKITCRLLTAFVLFSLFSCKEPSPEPANIRLFFNETVDLTPLIIDSAGYINAAGNEFMITELQYFISDVKLYFHNGLYHEISSDAGIHYIDSDLPETRQWLLAEDIPVGTVDSIVFTFGLDEETNQSGLFVNPPESNMFWPEELGGGYHYMKLNGKWMTVNAELSPFNYHLGIGQTYDTTGAVTGFVQNYFKVNVHLPVYSSFLLITEEGRTTDWTLTMNINSWFDTPNLWDFDVMGGMMMQNQQAMRMACQNGADAFSIGPYYE